MPTVNANWAARAIQQVSPSMPASMRVRAFRRADHHAACVSIGGCCCCYCCQPPAPMLCHPGASRPPPPGDDSRRKNMLLVKLCMRDGSASTVDANSPSTLPPATCAQAGQARACLMRASGYPTCGTTPCALQYRSGGDLLQAVGRQACSSPSSRRAAMMAAGRCCTRCPRNPYLSGAVAGLSMGGAEPAVARMPHTRACTYGHRG